MAVNISWNSAENALTQPPRILQLSEDKYPHNWAIPSQYTVRLKL